MAPFKYDLREGLTPARVCARGAFVGVLMLLLANRALAHEPAHSATDDGQALGIMAGVVTGCLGFAFVATVIHCIVRPLTRTLFGAWIVMAFLEFADAITRVSLAERTILEIAGTTGGVLRLVAFGCAAATAALVAAGAARRLVGLAGACAVLAHALAAHAD